MIEDSRFFVVEGDGVNDFYKDTLDGIIERGMEISPRGLSTKEVRPAMVIINKPRERFLTCPGRMIHPFFQMQESEYILGGRGDLEFIEYYLGNMKKYADEQKEFHAPYGVRMREWGSHRTFSLRTPKIQLRDQFEDCYNALLKDSSTRQAVMIYWNPFLDHFEIETNDRPCNIAFQFLIREGKLDLTIFNRSNDITYGLCNTNVVQFSVILETMAMLLEIPIGRQIHMINSLHAYDFQGDITKSVLGAKYSFNVYEHVRPLPFEMDLPKEDRVQHLDFELKLFFQIEEDIRKGKFDNSAIVPSFNYLQDGLILAKSFYHYKNNNLSEAMEFLIYVKADDIFVSAIEFLSRPGGNLAKALSLTRSRFEGKSLSSFSIEKIEDYIRRH